MGSAVAPSGAAPSCRGLMGEVAAAMGEEMAAMAGLERDGRREIDPHDIQ